MPKVDRLLERTGTSLEKRHWVRLNRACNNHCLFCLDSDCHDGAMLDPDDLMDEIRRGLAGGASRLVLSGGEPTIHPRFLSIIQKSVSLGYRWIQAISNGRRFAYGDFARRAVAAGLNEVTVSMHGHEAGLHDALTMAPGSFEQSVRGIRNLLDTRQCHVSVDVVMSSMNIGHLGDIVEVFAGHGIREFDLLFVQPFGRAWQERRLLLDRSHAGAIRSGVRRAQELGCWVWTNRVPAQYLEGMEELIQDPSKLLDDIGGRRELFLRAIGSGSFPACRGEKCAHCVLEKFCDAYHEILTLLGCLGKGKEREGGMSRVPVVVDLPLDDAGMDRAAALVRRCYPPQGPLDLVLRVHGENEVSLEAAAHRIAPGARRISLELRHGASGFERGRGPGHDLSSRIARIVVEPELVPLLRARGAGVLGLVAARKGVESLLRSAGVDGIAYLSCTDMVEEIERGPDFSRSRAPSPALTENVPPCLSRGRSIWPVWPYLAPAWFLEEAFPDPLQFASTFLRELNRVKSIRCAGCREHADCLGMHINYIRRHGFKVLKPRRGSRRRSPSPRRSGIPGG